MIHLYVLEWRNNAPPRPLVMSFPPRPLVRVTPAFSTPASPSSLSWLPKYLFYLLNDNNVRCLKILEIYSTASRMTKEMSCITALRAISGSFWKQWDRAVSLAVTPIELDPNGGWPERSSIRHWEAGATGHQTIRPISPLFALKMLFLLVLFLGAGAATAEKNK